MNKKNASVVIFYDLTKTTTKKMNKIKIIVCTN